MLIADRYEVVGRALAGGMAQVIPCRDLILERQVAIKIMPGSAHRRRVRDELSALLKMRSKHVVQVYDVLVLDEDDLAIVQEFVHGDDLFDPKFAPTSAGAYQKLIWQISAGIADIHSLGVIHRDIKPNNMKMDPEGVIKIFDFGLARDEGLNAATMGFVGTKGFAAPELYNSDVRFTSAVDTYAFGATALYLGMQDLPFELKQQPPAFPPAQYFSALPFALHVEVTRILEACLDEDPMFRPSMVEVRDVLARHILCDKHKALIVFRGNASYLDAANRTVSLTLPSMGEIEIGYDGFSFQVSRFAGDVFINNRRCAVADILPGACVVTLGAPEHQNRRKYITFDLSNPEIVL
jgi:serine/threonine protein kinase